jgi:uncharacterized membrane-anchored protein
MARRRKLRKDERITRVWLPYSNSNQTGELTSILLYHDTRIGITKLELAMLEARATTMWDNVALDGADTERMTRAAVSYDAIRTEVSDYFVADYPESL